MRVLWSVVLLAACGSSDAPRQVADDWTVFAAGERTGVNTRFLGGATWTPTEQEVAQLAERCPVLSRGRATKQTESFWLVEVEGTGLSDELELGALLPDDKLASIEFVVEGNQLRLPAACADCVITFGVDMGQERYGACLGPGYSLRFRDGDVSSP